MYNMILFHMGKNEEIDPKSLDQNAKYQIRIIVICSSYSVLLYRRGQKRSQDNRHGETHRGGQIVF